MWSIIIIIINYTHFVGVEINIRKKSINSKCARDKKPRLIIIEKRKIMERERNSWNEKEIHGMKNENSWKIEKE